MNIFNLPDSLLSSVSSVLSNESLNNSAIKSKLEDMGNLDVKVYERDNMFIAESNVGFTNTVLDRLDGNKSNSRNRIALTESEWNKVLF